MVTRFQQHTVVYSTRKTQNYSNPGATKTNQTTFVTRLKTNMSPEYQWLEDVFPVEHGDFPARHVSFRVGVGQVICSFFRRKNTHPSCQAITDL